MGITDEYNNEGTAASRFPDAAFAIALSGGGLSPAEQELFDSEYEQSKR